MNEMKGGLFAFRLQFLLGAFARNQSVYFSPRRKEKRKSQKTLKSLCLLHKISRARITRRVKKLFRPALFHNLPAFHVDQIIGQPDQESNRVRNDHNRLTLSGKAPKE